LNSGALTATVLWLSTFNYLCAMHITITRVVPEQVQALTALARQTFYDTFTGTCTEADMQQFLDSVFSEAALAKELANPNDHCYFANVDGVPAGYIRFMEDYSGLPLMQQWKALELKRIYVLQAYQGKGVAQQLLAFYERYAHENGYKALWLGVWEHNLRAQKFYEKHGFVNSGHTHDFPIGNTPQTDCWFWKFIDKP
jgi:diamine N-acetyltransferase